MKKLITLAVVAAFSVVSLSAQYFCTTQGKQMIYKSTDLKDNSEHSVKSTVLSVETAADGVISMREEDLQADTSNPLLEIKTYRSFTYNPETDVTKVIIMSAEDFKDFIMSMIRQSAEAAGQHMSEMEFDDLAKNISSKGNLEITLDPKTAPDTKLEKSTLRLSAGVLNMRANLWDVKFLGQESVTVPAGTYDCLKVSYTMVINSPNGNEKRNITEWYAKDLGLVKSIETDKKGNITSEDVLIAVK